MADSLESVIQTCLIVVGEVGADYACNYRCPDHANWRHHSSRARKTQKCVCVFEYIKIGITSTYHWLSGLPLLLITNVSTMITNDLKTAVEPTPETWCISNILQATDNVQYMVQCWTAYLAPQPFNLIHNTWSTYTDWFLDHLSMLFQLQRYNVRRDVKMAMNCEKLRIQNLSAECGSHDKDDKKTAMR
jgi:hypothetical protein